MSTHRTPDDRLAQMEALAADPHTDWDTLHFIAENYPSLRPAVARNPGTYPELLEALGAMNDPQIDAALASRASEEAGDPAGSVDAASAEEETGKLPPVTGADEATAAEQGADVPAPAFLEEQLQSPDPEEEQTQHIAAVPAEQPQQPQSEQHTEPQHTEPQHTEPQQSRPDQAAAAAYAQQVQAASAQPARRRSSRTPKVLAAVLLPVVGLIAVGVLVYFLLGDAGSQTAEEQPPAQEEPAAQEQEPTPEPSEPAQQDEAEDDTDHEAALEEARTELMALPDDSACQDPQQEAAVVAAFVDSASAADSMEQEAGTLEDLFSDLQNSCDAVHAAAVYEGVRSGEDEETADSFETVGTDWSDPMMDADGAQEMDSFITPDENMICVFDDGLTCTVLEQGVSAPAGCDDGATFSMQVDGDTPGLDCDSELSADEDYETLAHDDTATDGFLACVSLDDRISCWNTLTGVGFEMSERDHYAYSL